MSNRNSFCWPEAFTSNTTNFLNESVENVLAMQLSAWGNLYMGVPVPSNFFAVMDAASKITKVFKPDDCKDLFHEIMDERRNRDSSEE